MVHSMLKEIITDLLIHTAAAVNLFRELHSVGIVYRLQPDR